MPCVRGLPAIDAVNKRLDEWVAADRIDFSKLKAPEDEEEKKKQVAISTKTDKRDKKRKREGDDPATSAASAAEDMAAEVACATAQTPSWGFKTATTVLLLRLHGDASYAGSGVVAGG